MSHDVHEHLWSLMYEVTVFPQSLDLWYTAYIWTGLYDLEAAGKLKVKVSLLPRWGVGEANGQYLDPNNLCVFYMRVRDARSGVDRSIYVDLMDGEGIASAGGLEACDVYFKRSYRPSFLDTRMRFPQHRHKIRPFGLFFPVFSPHQHSELRRALVAELACKVPWRRPKESIWRLSERIKAVIENRRQKNSNDDYSRNDKREFEVKATAPDVKRIQFMTRAFDLEYGANAQNQDYVRSLNEQRAAIIRGMRKHFGDQFVGGLMDEPFTREHYPDCISTVSTRRSDYLQLLRESRVAISTTGLIDSIPAKLAEYFAASRCILTDELKFDLPYGVEHGRHVMVFDSVDSCISLGEQLLNDDTLAASMRQANETLYRSDIEPAQAILRCINTAFNDHSGKR